MIAAIIGSTPAISCSFPALATFRQLKLYRLASAIPAAAAIRFPGPAGSIFPEFARDNAVKSTELTDKVITGAKTDPLRNLSHRDIRITHQHKCRSRHLFPENKTFQCHLLLTLELTRQLAAIDIE